MRDMMNVAFQRSWFGPFSTPDLFPDEGKEEHAGVVYDDGPLDGLRTTSMWAQRFAQWPIINYAQARPNMAGAKLGQEPVFCRPGFIPVPTGVPGQSKCVRWEAPSAMIGPQPSLTVSSMTPPSYTKGQFTYPHMPRMGQTLVTDPYPFLPQAQRDSILIQIKSAMDKTKPIENLIAWSGDNDPGLKKYLGRDATRFYALSNSIAPLYGIVEMVQDRLSDPDPEMWGVADEDVAGVHQWTTGINEMAKIYDAHRNLPFTPTPGMTAPPAVSAPVAKGIATQDILIGGAVAVGLGLLIATLS